MSKLLKMMPYLVINILSFYLLPLLIQTTGTAIFILLIGIPLICFLTSFVYSTKNGFVWFYPVVISVLFIPTIFIFYNYTAWVYIFGYGIVALIGNLIGRLFYRTGMEETGV